MKRLVSRSIASLPDDACRQHDVESVPIPVSGQVFLYLRQVGREFSDSDAGREDLNAPLFPPLLDHLHGYAYAASLHFSPCHLASIPGVTDFPQWAQHVLCLFFAISDASFLNDGFC